MTIRDAAISKLVKHARGPDPDSRLGFIHSEVLCRMLGVDVEPNPFDTRLARMAYLVLPKLAMISMPKQWQRRMERLLQEMEEAGIDRTPSYFCFTQDNGLQTGQVRNMAIERGDWDPANAYYVFVNRKLEDPWANYRHGNIRELCPDFKGDEE